MDPITRAMQKLGDDAEAFWRASPETLLPLLAYDDQREEVVQALHLCEARPENRRPFVVFRAPYTSASTYFAGLAEQIAEDFERVRAGVAAEGVELPSFASGDDGTVPGDATRRAVLAMGKAARLFGERFAGIVVVLVPAHVADVPGWRESARTLAAMRWSPRVRVAVFDPLGGRLPRCSKTGAWSSTWRTTTPSPSWRTLRRPAARERSVGPKRRAASYGGSCSKPASRWRHSSTWMPSGCSSARGRSVRRSGSRRRKPGSPSCESRRSG